MNFLLIDRSPNKSQEWWKDSNLIIGKLSKQEIKIRIVNMLTYDEDFLKVPKEETLLQIVKRYLQINSHALSYTCLLYTSPSPRDLSTSRMPSSA